MSASIDTFLQRLTDSGILSPDEIGSLEVTISSSQGGTDGESVAQDLVQQQKLTSFQSEVLCGATPDRLAFRDYLVVDKIGQGGMGIVYKARHRLSREVVALKVLPSELTGDASAIRRFRREIETASKLSHPHIVNTIEGGKLDDTHYMVMEFVDGHSLSELVKSTARLPVSTAVDCTLCAAQGLQYAHEQGVVHRDIKPSNLVLDRHGNVRILDMGLARLVSPLSNSAEVQTQTELTKTGVVMGTVDYMAPEQALNSKKADHRADIYSLGCTLYFLLHAKAMFDGETLMEKFLAHREQPIPQLSEDRDDIPPALIQIYERMVAKQPDDRFQSMGEVVRVLETCRKENGMIWLMQRVKQKHQRST